MPESAYRAWEYEKIGDYHRNLDPNWSYTPTYLKKMKEVRRFVDSLPVEAVILDAGCGEGVLVEEFLAKGRRIKGIDLNYSSTLVSRGDVLSLPYDDSVFDAVLLLDVLEHLSYDDQPRALQQIRRVLRPEGHLFLSIPNTAHLNGRFRLFFKGRLDRTDVESNHPGERPLKENINLLLSNGFDVVSTKGITLTVPFLYHRVIARHAKRFRWLHDLLNVFALPSVAMINLIICRSRTLA